MLHLEELAGHKGSVLGRLPHAPQPSQRMFESRIHAALSSFDPELPVFVEAESRRIGSVQLPDSLLAMIRAAPALQVEASTAARIDFLLRDYDYFLADRALLIESLEQLRGLQSNETVARWRAMAQAGEFRALVAELLASHYDPLYRRSQANNYAGLAGARLLVTDDLSPAGMAALAREISAI